MITYKISIGVSLRDTRNQLDAVKDFPCQIHIYDRIFTLSTKEELVVFIHGLELGAYIEEEHEKWRMK